MPTYFFTEDNPWNGYYQLTESTQIPGSMHGNSRALYSKNIQGSEKTYKNNSRKNHPKPAVIPKPRYGPILFGPDSFEQNNE